jgi:hypothetical protein
MILEMEGVGRSDITNLGNWDPDTQEARYSQKLRVTMGQFS